MDSIRLPQRIVDGDFAGWLRDAMKARRMSTRMVGLRTGLSHSTIARLLYGYRQPTLANTITLLRLFGDGATNSPMTNGHVVRQERPDAPLL